ncbi:MAG: hypothetical protein J3K34DRAFT_525005 [Monoraphidium minutum]|nr:MAG: hypothetical protein J3K34DRAFT_525005 [Monoraphidium minutum]
MPIHLQIGSGVFGCCCCGDGGHAARSSGSDSSSRSSGSGSGGSWVAAVTALLEAVAPAPGGGRGGSGGGAEGAAPGLGGAGACFLDALLPEKQGWELFGHEPRGTAAQPPRGSGPGWPGLATGLFSALERGSKTIHVD